MNSLVGGRGGRGSTWTNLFEGLQRHFEDTEKTFCFKVVYYKGLSGRLVMIMLMMTDVMCSPKNLS